MEILPKKDVVKGETLVFFILLSDFINSKFG